MSNDVPAGRVDPNTWIVDTGRVWDEDEGRSRPQPLNDGRPLCENGPVDGGSELARFGENRRHLGLLWHSRLVGGLKARSGRARPLPSGASPRPQARAGALGGSQTRPDAS